MSKQGVRGFLITTSDSVITLPAGSEKKKSYLNIFLD